MLTGLRSFLAAFLIWFRMMHCQMCDRPKLNSDFMRFCFEEDEGFFWAVLRNKDGKCHYKTKLNGKMVQIL